MKQMKDINEALVEGFSIDQLSNAITPMEVDPTISRNRLAQQGIDLLEETLDTIQNECSTKHERKQAFIDKLNADNIEILAWAYIQCQVEVTKRIMPIRGYTGLGEMVHKFMRQLKRQAKDIQKIERDKILVSKKKHQPKYEQPDEQTLALLDKKPLTSKGEFIGWGDPYATKLNVELILRHDPRWFGRIRYCTFDGRTHLDGRVVDDEIEAEAGSWIARVYGFEMDDRKIGRLMQMIGKDDSYHPVRNHLDKLIWDGEHRIKNLLPKYMQSPDHNSSTTVINPNTGEIVEYEEYGLPSGASIAEIYGIRWMISAVARAYEPGCKVDTILCLINPKQGSYKSTTCLAMAFDQEDWFDETSVDIRNKDAFVKIMGKWIIEMQECETLHRSGFNAAKAFLSSRKDRFRSPYDRHAKDVARSCVFIATTNQPRLGFLNDVSGHRRYWVSRVGVTQPNALRQIIDSERGSVIEQMWAEAVHYYHLGHQWWLTHAEDQVRERLNDRYRETDSWEEEICSIIYGMYKKRLPNVMSHYQFDSVGVDGRNKNSYYLPRKMSNGRIYKESFLYQELGFTVKDILKSIGLYIKDQKQADFNRCTDIFTRIGIQRAGRKKVGRAYARLWYMPPNAFRDLICQYDYQSIVDLVEAPMDEPDDDRHIRLHSEYGAYSNPLIAYILTDNNIRLDDIRSR